MKHVIQRKTLADSCFEDAIQILDLGFAQNLVLFQARDAIITFVQQKTLTIWKIIVLFYCIRDGFWI